MFIVILLMRYEQFDIKDVADVLEKFLLISPHFSMAQGLNKLYANGEINKLCDALMDLFPGSQLCFAYAQCCSK